MDRIADMAIYLYEGELLGQIRTTQSKPTATNVNK